MCLHTTEAAATARLRPLTNKAPNAWRLQARRRNGTAIRMSLLYPSYEASERSCHLGRTTRLPTPRNRCLLSVASEGQRNT